MIFVGKPEGEVATLETEVGGKIILQLYFRKDM
jgi:hypothetical protein